MKRLLPAVAALTALLVPAYAEQPAFAEQRGHAPLEGTWRVSVQLKNCQTGTPLGPSFRSLLTFASGGTMSGTTANPVFMPGQRTPDFGIWSRNASSTYLAISEALIVFSGGNFTAGTQRIVHTITLADDANTFTDTATVQFSDVNGVPLPAPSLCAAATGQRMQ